MTNQSEGWHRPSIYDVADRAGVSHMTVSRVLNNHPNIKESTRSRVLQVIEEMDYTRSSIARALATRKAMRIGVIVDGRVEYGPYSTLRALERAARERGYVTSTFSVADDDDRGIDTGLVELVAQGVDAVCVIAPRSSSLDLMKQHQLHMPTLVIKAERDPEMMTVAVDQRAGATAAVKHLIDLGHTEILHISGPLDWLDARAREESWRNLLEGEGYRVRPPVIGDWTSNFGFHVGTTEPMIDEVTAVFAANDQMALGLVHGLSERGIRVPDDISVVGFDDLPDARHFLPTLTTVWQDFEALGTLCLSMLVDEIAGAAEVRGRLIEPQLIIRESTAPPRTR